VISALCSARELRKFIISGAWRDPPAWRGRRKTGAVSGALRFVRYYGDLGEMWFGLLLFKGVRKIFLRVEKRRRFPT
jgi:hypothetical protein